MTTVATRTALTIFMLLLLFLGAARTFLAHDTDPAWVSKVPMQEARSGLGVAVVSGKIYAIGGAKATGFSSTNEEYDPATDTWAFKAPMPTPRSDFGIAVNEDKIYCIGGYTKGSPPSGVDAAAVNEVYNPATDTWTSKASMPTARLNLCANVVNDKIYLIGGIPIPDTGRTLNEVYDPASDTWTTKAPIPTGVDLYASAVVGSKVFVIKSGLTQIYDAESDSWSTGAAPPTNSFIPSSATVANSNSSVRIYLFGANTEGPYWMLTNQAFTTQSYDPATDSWTVGTSMPTGRFDAGVAAVNGNVYVIGGYTYGAATGPGSNRPIVFSAANEQYTPAMDASTSADNTQTTPTPAVPLSTPTATSTPLPVATALQTLSPIPALSPISTSSPTQMPSLSSSPSTSSTPNIGTIAENMSTPLFPTFLLVSIVAVIAAITVIALTKRKL